MDSGLSLKAKLIAEQLVLLAMVCLVIGVMTIVGLRTFLVSQLDGQLTDASRRALVFVDRDRGMPSPPPPINAPGQGPGTINALLVGGSVHDAARQTSSGRSQSLGSDVHEVLLALPTDGKAHNRALGELGDYRLLATRTLDDDIVVITGLPLETVDDTMMTTGLLLGGIALLGLTIAGVAGVLIVRRTLRPLDRMAATAARVAELPLDRGEVALSVRVPVADTDPRTEVGKVGSALNRMLGHIGAALTARHASESRVRQFVADASHELRTPLAAIRGYAELAQRRGVDVTHALSRVESEAKRMTILVDDLLLLARLDAGRPLRHETLDLSRLVLDAVGDARVAGQDHRWRLDLPVDPVMMSGDEARLHQVAANLLANGRTHTPPGTTITTGLTVDGGEVVLTVADDGPGIPDALLPEVFERFARGDGSRSRAQGSTGLGLAIVAAVAHAHHGTVTVSSEPGDTVFTMRLPTHS